MKPCVAAPLMGTSLFRKYMMSKYTESVAREGGEIRWIPLGDAHEAARMAMECDGLLLPGGADIDPSLYGEEREKKCGKPNTARDAAEPRMLEAFLSAEKPVLAVCRGIQLVNVYFGGTLYQDISASESARHSDFFGRARDTHFVDIKPGTRLEKILGSGRIRVNSIHHQAVKTLGKGLLVSAVSEDGFTEGIELDGYPFLVGVQWHPEHMSAKNQLQRRLFAAFVAEL